MSDTIKVSYDGEYPNACGGTLRIEIDGDEVYNKQFQCCSTGSVCSRTDDDGNMDFDVFSGELVWDDADGYSVDIQRAVELELSKVDVCCGGCI